MFIAFQVITLLLLAVTLSCTLGHALELPGKMRLPQDTYRAVQTIYYPGFTWVGGPAEIAAIFATLGLCVAMRPHGVAFPLTIAACVSLSCMHLIFWLVTQPVNKIWMRGHTRGAAGAAFFRTGQDIAEASWTALRMRWEYSHVVRALLALAALTLVATAVAVAR